MEDLNNSALSYSEGVDNIATTRSYEDEGELLDVGAAKEAIKQGLALGVDVRSDERDGPSFDDTYKYHRNIGVWEEQFINWEWKLEPNASKKKELKPNLIDSHKFHAVRGIIVDMGWGAGIVNGKSKEDFIRGCSTFRAEEVTKDSEGNQRILSYGSQKEEVSNPSPLPFPRTWSTNDPTKKTFGKMNIDFPPNLNLYGKKIKPTIVKDKDGKDVETYAKNKEGKWEYQEVSCRECVANNKFSMDLGNKTADICKPSAHLIFVVFELGRQNIEKHFEDPESHPIGIDWVPVSEAGLKDCNGDPIDKPFALYFKNVAALYKEFGTQQHDLNIKFPSDYKPGDELDYWLPTDRKPMTLKDLYKWLIDPAGLGTRHNYTPIKTNDGSVVYRRAYTSLIDIYVAPMGDRNNYRPVFYPVPLDNEDCFRDIPVTEYWKAAKKAAREERDVAKMHMRKEYEESKGLSGATSSQTSTKALPNGSASPSNSNGNGSSNGTVSVHSSPSVDSQLSSAKKEKSTSSKNTSSSITANSFKFNDEEDDEE